METDSQITDIRSEELVRRLKAGDRSAFRELVEEHKNRVYNTCLGFLKNRHDAEDVSQEVFIQVHESIQYFREEAQLTTWLYRIAVTKSLELIRYRKRKKRKNFFRALSGEDDQPDDYGSEDAFNHPGLALEQKERADILFRTIETLAEKQRVAFTLHKIEGLSYKKIAEVMETSLPAVESLIHRAKENLKKRLYEYYRENELD